ncbi:MAG: hypothetical protein A3F83_03855 [Candidatus Glassbacteria bacterium RIFCSPLOWO2_12_FULL_58_11]|uniref:FlgD/Vpr Ig-like domain-containing protein n=1 Tax=Candidatus Glassbacteria bacterium RIFCSPLOWO2_12_FULL_58_11 TaxID=1817867 RepID=A0A1F5YKK3_9BACT|nr:MAG: hypothetical protein A3F83_03855 [Candidatus Glassbacteria bacterium RIFCSPLOWO2_12_FULL_58_11]
MNLSSRQLALPVALILYLNLTQTLPAGESTDTLLPGCSLRLSERSLEIVFPDGSVLKTPRDSAKTGIWSLSASGGLAQNLLQGATKELTGAARHPSGRQSSCYLSQNHPNPFNPSTTINYSIAAEESGPSRVRVHLEVFNLRGQLVRTLVNDIQEPGDYSFYWQGQDDLGGQLGSGVYLCRLLAGKYVATRKMVLAK